MIKKLSYSQCQLVNGGKAGKKLETAEATNAFMMAGSMFFPIVGVAALKKTMPKLAEMAVLGVLAEASIVALGTGVGVWVGYQIYYTFYD